MLTKLRIKNFRNWATEHWESGVALKPITLVLGRNSAGKTSILQPLRLLKQTLEDSDPTTTLLLDGRKLDGPNLGTFVDVIYDHDLALELGLGVILSDGGSWQQRWRLHEDRIVALDATAQPPPQPPHWLKQTFASFHYLGPLRPPPLREVTWSQHDPSRLGSMGTETIQALISNETGSNKGALKAAVSEWLKRLDLADAIEISRVGQTLLYQIDVLRNGKRSNLADVGYGVSQVLPVITLLHFVPEGSVILCEDPEAHLHPIAQAGLADLFVEVAKKRKLQVLIETHSEHLFRRLQFLIADERVRADDVALYYVERDEPAAKLTTIETDDYGRVKNWPGEFFGDAIGETERLIERSLDRQMAEKRKQHADG